MAEFEGVLLDHAFKPTGFESAYRLIRKIPTDCFDAILRLLTVDRRDETDQCRLTGCVDVLHVATAGQQVFTLVRRLRDELGVNTTCGASNVSFGLPNRHGINNAFLPMAMGAGMTSAIMNPITLPVNQTKIAEKKAELVTAGIILPDEIDDETFVTLFGMGSTKPTPGKEMEAIRAANFLFDRDPHGTEWIKFNKVAPKAGQEGRGRAGRKGGRRR